jgi:hypothetical protein
VLARSTSPIPAPPRPWFVVTTTELRIDDKVVAPLPPADAWAKGFDATYKRSGRNDFFIVPLADAARPLRAREAAIAIDGRVSYRIVVEVLFTLIQSGVAMHHFLVAGAGGKIASVDVTVKDAKAVGAQAAAMEAEMRAALGGAPAPSPASAPPELQLAVFLVADGISVKAHGANLGPGCKAGAGSAVPKSSGGYDFAALADCVARLAGAEPAAKAEPVTYAANSDVAFESVVGAIDAVRASFAGVQFGLTK